MDALLAMGRIAVDTAPLIYFLSGHGSRAAPVRRLLMAASQGEIELVVSAITEAELLVAPLRQQDPGTAAKPVHDLLGGPPALHVRPVTRAIARQAAEIRARWNLRLVDALVVATAVDADCQAILGNDANFKRVALPGLAYRHLDDLSAG